MKCPKCGFITFDHRQICPRCNKDISAEREKMHLPDFRPSPPSLLGGLTGDVNETSMGLKMRGPGAIAEAGLSPEDSQAIEAMEEAFKDSQDLEIQLEPEEEAKPTKPKESIDLPTLAEETEKTEVPEQEASLELSLEEEAGDEVPLDIEELTLEEGETEAPLEEDFVLEPEQPPTEEAAGAPKVDEETLSFDLKELLGEDAEIAFDEKATDEEGAVLDLEGVEPEGQAVETEPKPSPEEGAEAEEDLSLDLESLDLDLELEEPEDKSS